MKELYPTNPRHKPEFVRYNGIDVAGRETYLWKCELCGLYWNEDRFGNVGMLYQPPCYKSKTKRPKATPSFCKKEDREEFRKAREEELKDGLTEEDEKELADFLLDDYNGRMK